MYFASQHARQHVRGSRPTLLCIDMRRLLIRDQGVRHLDYGRRDIRMKIVCQYQRHFAPHHRPEPPNDLLISIGCPLETGEFLDSGEALPEVCDETGENL